MIALLSAMVIACTVTELILEVRAVNYGFDDYDNREKILDIIDDYMDLYDAVECDKMNKKWSESAMTLVEEIKKIQNKSKSLIWGSNDSTDTTKVFAVGHKSYPRVEKYFMVEIDTFSMTFDLSVLHDEGKTLVKKCKDVKEVVSEVILLLKDWFPAKEV